MADDALRTIGWWAHELFERTPAPEAVEMLLELYERGPCAQCRRHVVEHLLALDALPAKLADECRHDANEDVRALVDDATALDRPARNPRGAGAYMLLSAQTSSSPRCPMDDTLIFLVLALFAIGLVIASLVWTQQRAEALVERWAAANGYRLTHREPRYLRTGPYFWRHSRGQQVYYVTVADEHGRPRSAYLRLGGWFMGLFSEQVDVTWDG